MAALTRTESISHGSLVKPAIQRRLDSFVANEFERNLRLGVLTSDEMTLVKYFALKEGLIHNIPRVIASSPTSPASAAKEPLHRQKSLDLEGFFVWKPHDREQDIFDILKTFVATTGQESLQFTPDFDHRERWIAHYVAESMASGLSACKCLPATRALPLPCFLLSLRSAFLLCPPARPPARPLACLAGLATAILTPPLHPLGTQGLEHRSVDTPLGRCLSVWKERDLFGRLEQQRPQSQGFDAKSGRVLTHTDTWIDSETRGAFAPLDELREMPATTSVGDCADAWSLGSSGTSISGAAATPELVSIDSIGEIGGGGGSGGLEKSFDSSEDPAAGEAVPFSRQISDRVIHETRALRSRVRRPSQPKRITTGTGEVYEVRDGGTGERAIFKPAAQRRSSAAEEGGSSSSYSSSSDGFVALEHGLERSRSLSEPLDSALAVTHDRRRSGEGSDDVDDVDEHDGNDNNDNDDDEGRRRRALKNRREVAAYQLDHFGFAGVLPCLEVQVEHRPGVLQSFLEHEETADEDEFGRNQILALPVREVHKIGILDLRLFNEDRHGGNLLLDFGGQSTSSSTSVISPSSPSGSGGSPRIVPIDHEDTLPDWRRLGNATFCWHNWPQSKEPFDDETLSYIRGLSPARDAQILRDLRFLDGSISTYRICCTLLKRGAARGLSLRELGDMVVRPGILGDYCDAYGPLVGGRSSGSDVGDEGVGGIIGGVDEDGVPSTLELLVARAKREASRSDADVLTFGDEELSRFQALLEAYISARRDALQSTAALSPPPE
jgi:hypothetical protein